jgi:methionyl-tRNA formyltransferase
MRVVFFGTPQFAVPALECLLSGDHQVVAVVTQPDRPRTRSHSTLMAPPVKLAALAAGITVLQPERPRGDLFYKQMRDLNVDLGVVVAYGHILKPDLLAIPQLGMVNVHASLLPRWRGAAPIQWSVITGDQETGVSVMRMEAGLDCGPVWLSPRTTISSDDTAGDLFTRLADLGADAIDEALPLIEAGKEPVPQDDERVTLAPKIDRQTARIDWSQSASEVSCHIRGVDPIPGAWTELDGGALKCFGPTVLDCTQQPAGTTISGDGLVVACGTGAVKIAEVQPAGKRRMLASDWLRGEQSGSGVQFG